MAQYFPYIPETMPEPVLYTPDFNFLNSALQKKDMMFEQGVSQAASAYNAVLNAPLSNTNNISIRNQYIKEARENLKKMSSSDLSLPQNVQAAQSIFAPFWEDEFMLADTNATQFASMQQQKLAGWRDSTEDKTRAMYSPIVEQYLNNGLSVLQNAPRTKEAFSKVQKREAVPFTNVQAYLQEMAKKNGDGEGGLKIVYDETSPDGAYLISTTNGERSKKKFSTWAEAMIGNNMDEQFKITGIVQSENLDKYFKSQPQNANATDDQLNKLKADYVVNDLMSGYKKRINGVSGSITEIDNLLKAYPKNITDPQQAQAAKQLLDQRDQLAKLKEGIQAEYDGFDKNTDNRKSDLIQRITENSAGYFSTLAKQQTIDSWSTGRAEVESRKISKNEAFFSAQDQALKVQKQNLDQKQYELDVKKANDLQAFRMATLAGKGGKGKSKVVGYDEQGNPIIGYEGLEGEDKSTGAKYLGLGTTNVLTNTQTAYDVFMKAQSDLMENAHGKLFDPASGVVSVLKNAGLNDDEVMQISSGLKRQLTDGDKFAWNDKEKAALKKLSVDGGFKAFYKSDKVEDFQESIMSYAKDFYNKKKDNKIDYTNDELTVFNNYLAADHSFKEYLANEKNRKDLVKKNIESNLKAYSKITTTKNGQVDIISIDDLSKDMPELVLGLAGEKVKLSKKDVARLYRDGKLYQTSQGDFSYDGKPYSLISVNGITGVFAPSKEWNNIYNGKLTSKYGTSQEFNKLLTKANNSVVPNMQYYQNKTSQLGTVWQLDAEDIKNDPQSFAIIQEALLPSNQVQMYTLNADGTREVIDDMDKRNAIKMLLSSTDNISKYTGGAKYHTQGVNGHPMIELNLKEITSNNKGVIGGVDLTSLNDKSISIELSPEAQGPNLGNLPKNTGNYIYEKLLQGETVQSDDFMNSFGINYSVVPNNNKNPSGGTIVINYPLRTNYMNQQTGKIETKIETLPYREEFSFVGDSRTTPDEVMKNINQKITQLIIANQQSLKEYNSAIKASGASTVPLINLSDEMQKRGIK